jgi:hypothetical protein
MDEETSGVIDVSDICGSDTQNAYLIDVQAHFNLGGELRNARRSPRIEGQHRTCRKYSLAVLMLFERFRLSAMSHMGPDR